MCATRRTHNALRRLAAVWLIISLGACVPAQVPPQLAHTPGPAVVVAAGEVRLGRFTAWLPPGWQVITSAASDTPSVIILAPDEDALMMLSEAITEAPAPAVSGPVTTLERQLSFGDNLHVTVTLNSAADAVTRYQPIFQQVLESVRPRL